MSLPISRNAALKASKWLKDNFGGKINAAVQGTVFDINHVCGIACQETAYRWLEWLDNGVSAQGILGGCVLDGSGDYPGTSRGAFPRNTAEFRAKYGDGFTDMLVDEGNKMRELMGWGRVDWLYKGYGIFQYDLQSVEEDEAYFRNRGWYDFDGCLAKLMGEITSKWEAVQRNHGGEPEPERIRLAIRSYNGSGSAAEEYSWNVLAFAKMAAEVAGPAPGGTDIAAAPEVQKEPAVDDVCLVTGLEFEMELGSGDGLRTGNLIVLGRDRAVPLVAKATSGRPGHQGAGNQWEMGQGPLPALEGFTVRTTLDEPESNAQLGPRFALSPLTVRRPDGSDSRSGFYIRGEEGAPGTSGGIALLHAADFAELRRLLAATAASGVAEVPLKISYKGGVFDVTAPKLNTVQARFSMKLEKTDKMLYGTFVVTDEDGKELYSGRATSGLAGHQHPGDFWLRGKGVVPPTGDKRFIVTSIFNNDPPMGTRYQILPEEVSNGAGQARSAFRVHFDGGVPGSAGCIVTPAREDFKRIIELFAALNHRGVERMPLMLNYT